MNSVLDWAFSHRKNGGAQLKWFSSNDSQQQDPNVRVRQFDTGPIYGSLVVGSVKEGSCLIRVSKSKSGLTRDGRSFVLVYRQADGTYTHPIKLPVNEAIKIALGYAENQADHTARGVTQKAAEFIRAKVTAEGLLDSQPTLLTKVRSGDSAEEIASARSSRRAKKGFAPKYLPSLDAYREAEVSDDMVEILAFVLSGIRPAARDDETLAGKGATVRDLLQKHNLRAAPSSLLYADHRYVLYNSRRLSEDEFLSRWEEAKQLSAGQESTDLIKLGRRFDSLKIGPDGESLRRKDNAELIAELQSHATALLVRQYRSTRRKVDDINGATHAPDHDTNTHDSWFSRLGFGSKKAAVSEKTRIEVEKKLLAATKSYLHFCIRLGRLLRSDTAKRATRATG